MSDRSIARRYASALFDVTGQADRADQAGEELAEIARAVESHTELKQVFDTPTVPASTKKAIVIAVLKSAGGASDEVTRLMTMLAERGRLAILPELQQAYADRLLVARRVVPAEVVTAAPLTDTSRAALSRALAAATGSQVTLSERVDPDIVGGIIAKVGSVVFDGSLTRQLERLRQKLATNN